MTTDTKATYYDLDINGTTVETRGIVRAVLERAGLGADASHQLGKVLERAIRLGAKPGTDIAREVEKIHIEAGMLRDAVNPDEHRGLTAADAREWRGLRAHIGELERERSALLAECHRLRQGNASPASADVTADIFNGPAGMEDAPENEVVADADAALHEYMTAGYRARIAELEREREAIGKALPARLLRLSDRSLPELVAFIVNDLAQAERERDEWEKRSRGAEADLSEFVRQKQEAVKERDRLDRVARSWHDIADKAGDRIGELERERDEQAARADAAEKERDTWRDTAANVAGSREKLRAALDAERRQAVATAEELERVRVELAALRDRYRPRRQSEEPAPDGAPIMRWNATTMRWQPSYGYELRPDHTWTHQPPTPEGKGKVEE